MKRTEFANFANFSQFFFARATIYVRTLSRIANSLVKHIFRIFAQKAKKGSDEANNPACSLKTGPPIFGMVQTWTRQRDIGFSQGVRSL